MILLLVVPLVSVSTVLVAPTVTLLIVADARSVKSMTSLAIRLTMVSPFRSAAVSRKMSLPAMEPVSVLAPAPPVSTWPAPPAVILSAPALPTMFSPAVALAVKVVADASCTVVMPVMPAPMVAVPPPVTLSVLVPFVLPLMVTLPSVAEATLKVLLPPPLFTVSPAPSVTVSLPEPRLMTSLLAAPVMVMVGEVSVAVVSEATFTVAFSPARSVTVCAVVPWPSCAVMICDVRERRRRREVEGAPALQCKRVRRGTAVDVIAGGQRGGLGDDRVVGSAASDGILASGQRVHVGPASPSRRCSAVPLRRRSCRRR